MNFIHLLRTRVFLFVYLLLWFFFPAALVPLVPGIFFIDLIWKQERSFLSWWLGINLLSISFWAVLFWLSAIPGVTISVLFHIAIAAGAVYVFVKPPRILAPDRASLLQLLVIICLFGIPFILRISFSSGDMTEHMYTTKLLLHHNSIPTTYEPLFIIPEFGRYPIGLHLIMALVTKLSGLPIYRVSLFIFCYIFHLLFLSFYCLCGDAKKKWPAFAAAFLFIFLSHYPQFMFQWGSITTALSLAILIFLFSILKDFEGIPYIGLVFISILCAAAVLIQPIPVLGFIFYFPIFYLVMRGIPNRKAIFYTSIVICLSILFSIGYILKMFGMANPEALDFAYEWNLTQFAAVHPFVEKIFGIAKISPLDVPFAYVYVLGLFTTIVPVFVLFFVKEGRLRILYISFFVISIIILLSNIYHFLPFDYAFYPERILVFMGVPIILMYASILNRFKPKTSMGVVATAIALIAMSGAVISKYPYKSYYRLLKERMIGIGEFAFLSMAGGDYIAYAFDDVHSCITKDDIEVINWIRGNIPKDEVIDCEYLEGGQLISSVTGHKILRPHYQNFWYEKYMKPWQEGQVVRYYFRSKKPYFEYNKMDSSIWREMYRQGDSAVYFLDSKNK